MKVRVRADSNLMSQRRCAAEHPFGTLKRMTLSVLAYATSSAPVNLAGTEELARGSPDKSERLARTKRGSGNPEPLFLTQAARRRPFNSCKRPTSGPEYGRGALRPAPGRRVAKAHEADPQHHPSRGLRHHARSRIRGATTNRMARPPGSGEAEIKLTCVFTRARAHQLTKRGNIDNISVYRRGLLRQSV